MKDFFADLSNGFYKSLIKENRYIYIIEGLQNTIIMSLLAIFIGIVIGIFVAVIGEISRIKVKSKTYKVLKKVSDIYVGFIRGTPAVLQLMIMYYVVFRNIDAYPIIIGSLAFGLGSGAYVSEIIRAGINSVDKGQSEAAKSLGLNDYQRMRYVVLPQAVKNILPAIINEFIVVIKGTSIAGYIGIKDLSQASKIISSRTYDYFFPLLIIAVIYVVIILTLTKLAERLERRLNSANT